MADYIIMTDTGCDILPEKLDEWNVGCVDLLFRNEADDKVYTQRDVDAKAFYSEMRAGSVYRTAAANMDDFFKAFEPKLEEGKDILYLGFSSGLSSTVGTAFIAANELMEKYPGRKVTVIDTLAASAGHGLLVYMAVNKKNEGASMDEVAELISANVLNMCHWFTVEDLVYLKRSGRCSAAAAFMGNVLNIKPVLHVDNEGHLIPMFKVRGRKKSINSLIEQYAELALDAEKGDYFISHGDCLEDAESLEKALIDKFGNKAALITDIGAVIGSHSGPGTLALFFLGKNR